MNVKRTRKTLNVEFKQFQRLPDWTRVKTSCERPEWKMHVQPKPTSLPLNTNGGRAHAE
jgi:hypothetical protein